GIQVPGEWGAAAAGAALFPQQQALRALRLDLGGDDAPGAGVPLSEPRLWLGPRPRPQRSSEPEVVGRAELDRPSRRREGGDSKRLWSQGKTRPGPPTWRCRAPA